MSIKPMNTNLGMYIEQLVDRTISYYQFNNFGFLEKRQIPIKILKHINETTVVAKLIAKAKVDYFGYINEHYVEMECKQTKHEYFDIALIKHHQLNYLKYVDSFGYDSILLIYFEKYDKVIALSYQQLLTCKKLAKKNALPFNIVAEQGTEIEIIYPGILNLKKLF
ncbi:MAG: Holliday junction resolvase RecU [Mycoplasmoidaceae bacterium]|nr:Holliday junction resolvase RecU [Mycoplasmoidaceae bacterium]